jgi:predicted Zn-dependent peptidase
MSQQRMGHIINQSSPADEIRKYKELLDDGVITQEEFEQKKKQLLGL